MPNFTNSISFPTSHHFPPHLTKYTLALLVVNCISATKNVANDATAGCLSSAIPGLNDPYHLRFLGLRPAGSELQFFEVSLTSKDLS